MIDCPVCPFTGATAEDVTQHINRKHFSSPQANRTRATQSPPPKRAKMSTDEAVGLSSASADRACPVCEAKESLLLEVEGVSFEAHVEAHFTGESASHSVGSRPAGTEVQASLDLDDAEDDDGVSTTVLVCSRESCGARGRYGNRRIACTFVSIVQTGKTSLVFFFFFFFLLLDCFREF